MALQTVFDDPLQALGTSRCQIISQSLQRKLGRISASWRKQSGRLACQWVPEGFLHVIFTAPQSQRAPAVYNVVNKTKAYVVAPHNGFNML